MTSQPATFEFVHTAVPAPAPHPTPASGRSQRVRWAPYDAETASRKSKPTVTPRSVASDIPLDKLRVSADQHAALEKMYRPSGISSSTSGALADHLFMLNDDDQLHASAIMAQHGLFLQRSIAFAGAALNLLQDHLPPKQHHPRRASPIQSPLAPPVHALHVQASISGELIC
ncbi:hypothetical protein C8J57DRAFT_1507974 [Mycena rebaudengoi]|nr:hypothetical protein C8J57DRAFT_1507974 [Mycena rebaudengoi]